MKGVTFLSAPFCSIGGILCLKQLRKINLQRKELETAEQKLKNAGFGDILDAFQTKILLANDVYEKFAIYIKSKVNSDTLDIETFLKSFENRIKF